MCHPVDCTSYMKGMPILRNLKLDISRTHTLVILFCVVAGSADVP